MVYELLHGFPPFYSKNVLRMYDKILYNNVEFVKNVECSNQVKDFICGLLMKDPTRRLGAVGDRVEVMNHP